MLIYDLLLLTGAAYGFSWIMTKSKIMAPLRTALQEVPFFGSLLQCIVCVSFWIGLALIALLPWSGLFEVIGVAGWVDRIYLVGWVVFSVWGVARLLGDAD